MQTLAQIKQILESRGIAPKKSLGQNFLIDHNLIRKLVDAARVGSGGAGGLVLEVGPGTGTMTEELLARGAEVVACELDDHLSDMLAERARSLPGGGRLTVVHADCLEKDDGEKRLNRQVRGILHYRPFVLVSNLPYGAGTPLISTLLLHHPECPRLAVTVQREVADRLLAPPGTRDRGGLSVIAQALCTLTRVATAPPACFWPRPDVTSAMVLLERRERPLTASPGALSEFCRRLFASRRKQLGAILGRSTPWPDGVEPAARPEALTVEQIEALRLAIGGPAAGADPDAEPPHAPEPTRGPAPPAIPSSHPLDSEPPAR